MKKSNFLLFFLGTMPDIVAQTDFVYNGLLKVKVAGLVGSDVTCQLICNHVPNQGVSNVNVIGSTIHNAAALQGDFGGWNFLAHTATASFTSKVPNPLYDSSAPTSLFNNPQYFPANFRTAQQAMDAYTAGTYRVAI
jgi:hypothetical protein